MKEEKNVSQPKIYVYIGTYKNSSECDIEHGYNVLRVKRNDELAEYNLYCDLEKEYIDGQKEVLINEISEFEKNNIVLYPNRYLFYKDYEEVRKIFLETLNKSGKEVAIQKVLSYNN